MLAPRRITALLARVEPVRDALGCGVALGYTPTSRNARDLESVEDFADLGPGLTLASSRGLGIVLRVLRAARLAAPRPADAWLDEPELASDALRRAIGRSFAIDGVSRMRMRFTAWTEEETIDVDAVSDVVSDASAFLIHRIGHRGVVRIPRAGVVRHETRKEAWFQITGIERA